MFGCRGVVCQKVPQGNEQRWPSDFPRLLWGHHRWLWQRWCVSLFWGWHILVGHIGHTPFTLFTRCPECSQVFGLWSSGLWSLRCMLCIAMCIYVTESHFCSLLFSSNSVDSDNFVHFLVHSNRTHEFLTDNLMVTKHCGGTDVWCRSYLAACLGPRPIQYIPRNHWYVYVYTIGSL